MSRSDTRGTVRELRADLQDTSAHRDRRNWNMTGTTATQRAVRMFKRNRRRAARAAGKNQLHRNPEEA